MIKYAKPANLTETTATVYDSAAKKLGTIRFSLEIIEDTIIFTREIVSPNRNREPINITTAYPNRVDESHILVKRYHTSHCDDMRRFRNLHPIYVDLTTTNPLIDENRVGEELQLAFKEVTNKYSHNIAHILYMRYFSENADVIAETELFDGKFTITGPVTLNTETLYCGTHEKDHSNEPVAYSIDASLTKVITELPITNPTQYAYLCYETSWYNHTRGKEWVNLHEATRPCSQTVVIPGQRNRTYTIDDVTVKILESTDKTLYQARIYVYYLVTHAHNSICSDFDCDTQFYTTNIIHLYDHSAEGLLHQLTNQEQLTRILDNYPSLRAMINDITIEAWEILSDEVSL